MEAKHLKLQNLHLKIKMDKGSGEGCRAAGAAQRSRPMQLIPATLCLPSSPCSSSVCCLTSIPNTAAGAFPQGFSLGEKLKKKKKVAIAFPAPSAEENQPGGNEEGRGRGTLSAEPPGEQHRAAGCGAGGPDPGCLCRGTEMSDPGPRVPPFSRCGRPCPRPSPVCGTLGRG